MTPQTSSYFQGEDFKKLGINAGGYFSWVPDDMDISNKVYSTEFLYDKCSNGWYRNRLPAFTLCEILQIIPLRDLQDFKEKESFVIHVISKTYTAYYDGDTAVEKLCDFVIKQLRNGKLFQSDINAQIKKLNATTTTN